MDSDNLVSMSQSLAPYAIMGLGVTFVIATGGIDLSIGTVCIAAAVVAGKLLHKRYAALGNNSRYDNHRFTFSD